MKTIIKTYLLSIAVVFECLALLQTAQAVSPEPDGCYPGYTTAEGCGALHSLTGGLGNTGVGWYSLFSNSTGNYNTGLGAGTLALNNADLNTATGVAALFLNTGGTQNTANGAATLVYNDTGSGNTATGQGALFENTSGSDNTANGLAALNGNTIGAHNVAVGDLSLFNNDTGNGNVAIGTNALAQNTSEGFDIDGASVAVGYHALTNADSYGNNAVGDRALESDSTGSENTAVGLFALQSNANGIDNTGIGARAGRTNVSGNYNVAVGAQSLINNTGSSNIAVGHLAGFSLTSGSGNICIGEGVIGVAGEDNTTRIRNIYGSQATTRAVYVTADDKLGTLSSSRRYKNEIKPMDKASEGLFALKPVTFRYKKEIDPARALSFGLIAEEVAEISPDLTTCDKDGKPETVRYEAINAMLLNEFLKEHRKVQELEATVVQQQKGMAALVAHIKQQDSKIQQVSDQIEMSKAARQVATAK